MAKIHTALVWELPPLTFRVKQLPDGSYCFDERHGGRRLRARSQNLEKLQREAEAFVRPLRPADGAESESMRDHLVAPSRGKKPLRLDFGKVIIPVTQYADGRYVIDHTVAGERIRITRMHLDEIRVEAKALAERIAGKPATELGMAPWEREDYVAARGALEGLNVPLHTVAGEWREARALLGSFPLLDFIRQHQRAAGRPVPEIFAEFIAAKERQGRGAEKLSARYLRALRFDVGEFADAFPVPIGTLPATAIQSWADDFDVGARRRNNIVDSVVTFFRFAQLSKDLDRERKTEAELVPKAREIAGEIEIFTPAEMRALIAAVSPDWKPWVLIGGFAGVRTEELSNRKEDRTRRVFWEDINWTLGHIVVWAEVAKNGIKRLVPMAENLQAWLAPWLGARGPVIAEDRPEDETQRLIRTGFLAPTVETIDGITEGATGRWKRNGLRHSYGSYQCALMENYHEVSYRMGNSPAICRSNYHNVQPRAAGEEFFGIMPSG